MALLFLASILWAFSFGLIKRNLAGVDAGWLACIRLALSLAVFLPALRIRGLTGRALAVLVGLGAVQYGVMYVLYLSAFRYLAAHEVALFTVFTPVFVTVLNDAALRRFHRLFLWTSLLAVAGSAAIVCAPGRELGGALLGFALVQGSNLSFAAGQVGYRLAMARTPGVRDRDAFALLYLGGAAAAGAWMLLTGGAPPALTGPQWATVLYLGVVPSGLAFFLWNAGARRVTAGTLAAMNNAKVPLGVLAAVVWFGERPAWGRLALGSAAIIAAALLARRAALPASPGVAALPRDGKG